MAPSKLARQLVARAREAAAVLGNPSIARVFVADPQPSPERDAEFGLLMLADGSAGLYYAWLQGEQERLPARVEVSEIEGASALSVAQRYLEDSDIDRSLGIAAINALTAALFARAGYAPPTATDGFAGLQPQAGDRLGMVGNFPPLVRRAIDAGASVRVVERKTHMLTSSPALTISLDPTVLAGCNTILCTGATLLNDTCADMIGHCRGAARLALLGPTVGCFPDDLFALGVDVVAGTEVSDSAVALARLETRERLGACLRRTAITPTDYPGFARLLERASA